MFRRTCGGILLAALGVSAAGCSAGDLESGALDTAAGADEVAQIEEAIGDPGCGTMQCNAQNSCALLAIPQCRLSPSALAIPPYGSGLCPNQAVIGNTAPPTNGSIGVNAFWSGVTLTPANCASATIQVTMYARNGVDP